MSAIIDSKEALKLMPAINASMFKRLLSEGKGPKHARIGNVIKFRTTDIDAWYAKWQDTAFSQTKTAPVVRRTTAAKIKQGVAKMAKNGKAKEKVSEKELLG
jgi:predicted DNA-binding transcriptional regulator AlpA